MSGDDPFGFTPKPQDPDDPAGSGSSSAGGPFGFGLPGGEGAGEAGFDLASIGAALQQLGTMLQAGGAGDGGPVNWTVAHDVARQALASAGDPSPGEADRRAVEAAVELAELWLDPATEFPTTQAGAAVWSRSEWLEATLPAWQRIVEPIADRLQTTMSGMMPGTGADQQLPEGLPVEIASMAGPLLGMAKAMGSAMFGMQVGQGLAALAAEVVSSGDVGIPLTDSGHAALLPENVRAFGAGLGLPDRDVLLFLALREAAHQRLFAHVPWLRARAIGAVEAYAAGIAVDQSRIEEAMRDLDPGNPEALQNALSSGVFEPEDTEEQRAALARLETLLALVEGWVDDVVDAAVAGRLGSYDALREVLRRRRATGGPAEKTFATLVGLELRPRRLRDAAKLWEQLRTERGIPGRDALWGHPDLLPDSGDLSDPDAFVAGQSADSDD